VNHPIDLDVQSDIAAGGFAGTSCKFGVSQVKLTGRLTGVLPDQKVPVCLVGATGWLDQLRCGRGKCGVNVDGGAKSIRE